MSSFGVNNVLRKDIVTHDIFFNKSEDIVDYFTIKCPQFNYKHLSSEEIVKSRAVRNYSMEITDSMKQHLLILTPNELGFCNCCLQFNFKECLGVDIPLHANVPCNDEYGDGEGDDGVLNKSE